MHLKKFHLVSKPMLITDGYLCSLTSGAKRAVNSSARSTDAFGLLPESCEAGSQAVGSLRPADCAARPPREGQE